MRFQPSAYSYGVISEDQILATAQLTTAAAGAGTSLVQTFRKKKRRRRRRRAPAPAAAAPTQTEKEPEKSRLPLILGIAAVLTVIGGTTGVLLYRRKKQSQGNK
jgi:hypothetical protein